MMIDKKNIKSKNNNFHINFNNNNLKNNFKNSFNNLKSLFLYI